MMHVMVDILQAMTTQFHTHSVHSTPGSLPGRLSGQRKASLKLRLSHQTGIANWQEFQPI